VRRAPNGRKGSKEFGPCAKPKGILGWPQSFSLSVLQEIDSNFKRMNEHPWFRTRGYLHFDLPISIRQAEAIATSPKKVERHPFYPFISYQIKSKKVRKDPADGSLKIKEKSRPVSYASHVDSQIYSYYAFLLTEKYETLIKELDIDKNVLAFRKLGKSNIDFANDAFEDIARRKYCTALAFDIEGFFDNIDHAFLKKSWCKVIGSEVLPADHYSVFKSITKFSKVEKDIVYKAFGISKYNPKKNRKRICNPQDFRDVVRRNGMISINSNNCGIPQGSPVSALLSNICMIEFDENVSLFMKKIDGSYFRYCDDILCIVPTARKEEIQDIIGAGIRKLNLSINNDKTKIVTFKLIRGVLVSDRPLQYLGFTFDGQHKLLRSAALARYSERMKAGVRLAKLTKIKHNRKRIEKGASPKELYKRKIYERYSHLGKRNFIRYGLRSAATMNSDAMKKQLKPLWTRLQEEIAK